MEAFYQVNAFAPHDPNDKKGRQGETYEDTLLASEAAYHDFRALVASGKYEYVTIEWVGPSKEEATNEANSTEAT